MGGTDLESIRVGLFAALGAGVTIAGAIVWIVAYVVGLRKDVEHNGQQIREQHAQLRDRIDRTDEELEQLHIAHHRNSEQYATILERLNNLAEQFRDFREWMNARQTGSQ